MLLVWRRLNDLFSYTNIVNSNSQYLALQHVLFIYRDGTTDVARTSGHGLANPDNMAVFWSGRKQLELQKTLQLYVNLQIYQPMYVQWRSGLNFGLGFRLSTTRTKPCGAVSNLGQVCSPVIAPIHSAV
ncbi:hypothetical protein NP493_1165g00033 [Ridgeia piscesae]|uniref:Uncharacterized protein n=1 Tax=Ridgeia piscesae TaxID=27915 RepID=A0AAD9NIR5_RIDPI|nr:hypothetical protein NP493_1165g00033 [Ridgeia piscesae]